MRRFLLLFATATLLSAQSSTQTSLQDPPVGGSVFLIRLGLTDAEPTNWNGTIRVENGELRALIGREFRAGDVVHPPNRWEASTRPGFEIGERLMYEQYFSAPDELRILEPSLYAFVDGGPAARMTVDTE